MGRFFPERKLNELGFFPLKSRQDGRMHADMSYFAMPFYHVIYFNIFFVFNICATTHHTPNTLANNIIVTSFSIQTTVQFYQKL
jgi:hypothetical protein